LIRFSNESTTTSVFLQAHEPVADPDPGNPLCCERTIRVRRARLAFDPAEMRAAFDAGRALAKQPDPWSSAPPNVGDIPAWAMDAIKAKY
jgi:hypothetical protein